MFDWRSGNLSCQLNTLSSALFLNCQNKIHAINNLPDSKGSQTSLTVEQIDQYRLAVLRVEILEFQAARYVKVLNRIVTSVCIESTLDGHRIGLEFKSNDLYRNEFVSNQPDTV